MNDEQLYLKATQEVDSGTQNSTLWAKAMTLAEGDEEKARHHYITLRVEELSKVSASAPSPDPVPSIDSSDVLRPTPDNSAFQTPHPPTHGARVVPEHNTLQVEPSFPLVAANQEHYTNPMEKLASMMYRSETPCFTGHGPCWFYHRIKSIWVIQIQ